MLRTFSTRDKRRVRLTYARWRRRAIFLLGGVAVGAAAVALAQAADLAQQAFAFLLAKSRYIVLAITPLGFMLSAYLTIRLFPNAQGSGIPQAIAARHLTDQSARESLVSMRIAVGKVILTLFGLLCGGRSAVKGRPSRSARPSCSHSAACRRAASQA